MLGDTMTLLPAIATAHEISVIFLSPPWGGPEYLNLDVFDISSMTPDG